MAKVFGIHEIELRPDVTADAFEQFARDVLTSTGGGCTIRILKGDRGARAFRQTRRSVFHATEPDGETDRRNSPAADKAASALTHLTTPP